jgi:hypothetical protein
MPASISPTAWSLENGVHAMSPASTTWWSANGNVPLCGLNGRRRREAWRMADGPSRAPGRYVVPVSKGTPTTATWARCTWSISGSRAKVEMPAKRGTANPSTGPRTRPGADGSSFVGSGGESGLIRPPGSGPLAHSFRLVSYIAPHRE